MELREIPDKLTHTLDENAQLVEEIKTLRQVITQLRDENTQLKAQISDQKDVSILGT